METLNAKVKRLQLAKLVKDYECLSPDNSHRMVIERQTQIIEAVALYNVAAEQGQQMRVSFFSGENDCTLKVHLNFQFLLKLNDNLRKELFAGSEVQSYENY